MKNSLIVIISVFLLTFIAHIVAKRSENEIVREIIFNRILTGYCLTFLIMNLLKK